MNDVSRPIPRQTAQVAPYVEVLGSDLSVDFLLRLGGAEIAFSKEPRGASQMSAMIGLDSEAALHAHRRVGPRTRIPLAKKWLAEMLRWRGFSAAEIARTLRASDVSVRRWLHPKT